MRYLLGLILLISVAAPQAMRAASAMDFARLFVHDHDDHAHNHGHGDIYHTHAHNHGDGVESDAARHAGESHEHEHTFAPQDESDFSDLDFITSQRLRLTSPVWVPVHCQYSFLTEGDSSIRVSRPPPQTRAGPRGSQTHSVLSTTVILV